MKRREREREQKIERVKKMAQGILVFGTRDVHTGRNNDSHITHKTCSSRQKWKFSNCAGRNTISSTFLHKGIYCTNTILISIQRWLCQTLRCPAGVLWRNTITGVIKYLLSLLYPHQTIHLLPPVVHSRYTDLLRILLRPQPTLCHQPT